MELFLLPKKINFQKGDSANKATVTIEPLYFGYGTTLGNALRRVLLSSLPGAAVTAVKIKNVDQEFQAIPNVKEDALNVMLNLKNLRVKVFSEEPVKIHLKAKGEGKVTAKDIEKNAEIEIVNPELQIATITDKKGELEMEITVQKGRGYMTVEERGSEDVDIGTMLVDSIFTPVRKIGYKVENTRVGDITDYDKLTLDIETDGTITPEHAVSQAAQILMDHFKLLVTEEEKQTEVKEKKGKKSK